MKFDDKKSREEYLSKLENSLYMHFGEKETAEILADYNDFFDSGLQEGKSEQQLIDEFGSPEDIALQLHNEKLEKSIPAPLLSAKVQKTLLTTFRVLIIIVFLLISNSLKNIAARIFVDDVIPIQILILSLCLCLFLLYLSFKPKPHKANNTRSTKIMLIISYILPIASGLSIYAFLQFALVQFSILANPIINTVPIKTVIFYMHSLDNFSSLCILATSVLTIFITIRKRSFSLMQTGLQFALFSLTYYCYGILANIDLSSGNAVTIMIDQLQNAFYGLLVSVVAVFTVHVVSMLITNSKNIQEFYAPIFALAFSLLSSYIYNVTIYQENLMLSATSLCIFITFGIILSYYTKYNSNLCCKSRFTDKLSLGIIIMSSLMSLPIMFLSKKIFENFAHYDIDLSQLKFEFIALMILDMLGIFMWLAFVIFSIIYIINGKSKSSHRYLCLIANAPILIMLRFNEIHSYENTTSTFWHNNYVTDMREFKSFALWVLAVSVALPLIAFAVSKILQYMLNKRGLMK